MAPKPTRENPPLAFVVSELASECGIKNIDGRRCLNPAGQKAVELTGERLADLSTKYWNKETFGRFREH